MTFYPSAGWSTLYDVDFTSLANQDLTSGGDGNKTIDGKTWRADNTGNAAVMDILNGTGMRIQLALAGEYLNGTRTAPIMALAITEITGATTYNPLRFWAEFSLANITVPNEGGRMGVEVDTANPLGPAAFENHMLSIQQSGANVVVIPISTQNSSSAISTNPNNYASQDLYMVQLNSPNEALHGLGTAATDLLTPEALEMVGATQFTNTADWAVMRTDNTRFFACVVDTASTDVLLTLKRLVIEMRG
jgi:hypothetical protein